VNLFDVVPRLPAIRIIARSADLAKEQGTAVASPARGRIVAADWEADLAPARLMEDPDFPAMDEG